MATSSATPNWTANLAPRGLDYEGLVENIDTLLEMHKLSTVSARMSHGDQEDQRQCYYHHLAGARTPAVANCVQGGARWGETIDHVSHI